MKRYTLVYKQSFCRTRSMDMMADSLAKMTVELDPMQVWVEHVIDWENQIIHPVSLTSDKRLVKLTVDDEYGEATPAGYFEENDLCEEL